MLNHRGGSCLSVRIWTCVACAVWLLVAACGGRNTTDGEPLFSDEIVETLRGVRDDFRAKLQRMDFEQARLELLTEISAAYPEVVSVSLAADGLHGTGRWFADRT
jgi:hypothetical protein